MVGLGVVLTVNVGDGEVQGAGQLAADPIQRIETRAAARIFAFHLTDNNLRIRVNVYFLGFESHGTLQRLQQGEIFGDVVVLPSDRFRDTYRAIETTINDDPNTRRSRISQRPTVDVSHQR